MTILFVRGVNDQNLVTPRLTRDGGLAFKFDGSCSVYRHMGFSPHMASTLLLMPQSVEQPKIRFKKRPALVFNEIADPDSHRTSLERCVTLCSSLGAPVINHPANILCSSRDNVARLLEDIPGVRMPKTVRFTPLSPEDVFKQIGDSQFKFPVIVRIAGVHGGKSSVLIEGEPDLHKLHVYPFDGSAFYLTQFVDYRSEDGLYRKFRIVVIDGEPMMRHQLMNPEWMVHAASRAFMKSKPGLWEEEADTFRRFSSEIKPSILSSVEEITRRLNLEYYGIDFNIDSRGEMLIFEANANMNVLFNNVPDYEERVKQIKQKVKDFLNRKTRR